MSKIESKDINASSAEDKRKLAALLTQSEGKRISSAQYQNKTIWIKRYDVEKLPLAKRLHGLITPLLPFDFLKSSKIISQAQMAKRERRKQNAFKNAGLNHDFTVPNIIYSDDQCLVMEDVSPVNQIELNALRKTDAVAHDALLIRCATALAKAHKAGLCHGRPHPRDFFVKNGQAGFFDFEEEPEAVMPLATAQARDLWLLFFQISSQALDAETPNRALSEYKKIAPADILPELEKIIRFFRFTIAPLRFFKRFYLGGDGRRLLKAMEFFDQSLKYGSDKVIDDPKKK